MQMSLSMTAAPSAVAIRQMPSPSGRMNLRSMFLDFVRLVGMPVLHEGVTVTTICNPSGLLSQELYHCLRARTDLELFVDIVAVLANCFDVHAQQVGNFFVG